MKFEIEAERMNGVSREGKPYDFVRYFVTVEGIKIEMACKEYTARQFLDKYVKEGEKRNGN